MRVHIAGRIAGKNIAVCGIVFFLLRRQYLAHAAIARHPVHRVEIHAVANLPARLLRSQVIGKPVRPPVAHLEVGTADYAHIADPDRGRDGNHFAELAGHVPAHAQLVQEGVDRVLGAVVGACVVAGQHQNIALLHNGVALLLAAGGQTGGNDRIVL